MESGKGTHSQYVARTIKTLRRFDSMSNVQLAKEFQALSCSIYPLISDDARCLLTVVSMRLKVPKKFIVRP